MEAYIYEHTDIPPGVTLAEHRRELDRRREKQARRRRVRALRRRLRRAP